MIDAQFLESLAKTKFKKSELHLLDAEAKTKISQFKIELKELRDVAKKTALDYCSVDSYKNGFSPRFYQKRQQILVNWSNEMARCGMKVWR